MTEDVLPRGEEGAIGASQFAAVAAYGRFLLKAPLVRSKRLILTDVDEVYDPDDEIIRWLHIDISDTRDGFVYYRSCGALVVGYRGVHLGMRPGEAVVSAPFTGAERGETDFPLDRD